MCCFVANENELHKIFEAFTPTGSNKGSVGRLDPDMMQGESAFQNTIYLSSSSSICKFCARKHSRRFHIGKEIKHESSFVFSVKSHAVSD